ncbi:hypothetical protein CAPTEDRAFT_181443 [Capitella teleta]|uniref:methylcrotonoyl-CoA carboxylase n=1 Tax=Capitella teleta TaxID=283909 RepID=R7TJA6_CAPTE|nr:hypothetical protein CAPTEDRAFT_181443 [Capitella teleta]|eukprot:ELT91631.1 hypothetical protein CAPTEDRAFT_181443 [Capitella teleta]
MMALRSLSLTRTQVFRLSISTWKTSIHCRYMASSPSKKLFKQLNGSVDISSDEYKRNLAKSQHIINKYQQILAAATSGGGEKAVARHTQRNKKLLAQDRLRLLFDDADDALEVMPLAGIGMKYGDIPRAGILAVIGKINGIYCLVIANDATVKAGTIYPISLTKQLRCMRIVEHCKLPCVFVVDSGGAFLPLQSEIFNPGGRTFYKEALFNAMGIPQMAIVVGSCTAGAAYVPAMVQEAVIVKKIGTIFLAGPPLVKAALGELISPEDLGGADVHCSKSGLTDHYAETEEEAFETGRDIVASFNVDPVRLPEGYDEPAFDPEELIGLIPCSEQHFMDMYQVIARIVDGSRFQEFKQKYGQTLITGFAFIKGHLVGLIGNQGSMTEKAALKGAHFIQVCDQRNIPIIFLQNTAPDSESDAVISGKSIGGHSKLMSAVACCQVPKITVIVGNSFGPTNYMMAGRSFDPRFLFSWPNSKICISEPDVVMKELSESLSEEQKSKLTERVETQSNAVYASGRIWDDGVILPQDTRKVLGQCLNIISQKLPAASKTNYNVMRI